MVGIKEMKMPLHYYGSTNWYRLLERNVAEFSSSKIQRPNNQRFQPGICTPEGSQVHKGSCTRMSVVEMRSWVHPRYPSLVEYSGASYMTFLSNRTYELDVHAAA